MFHREWLAGKRTLQEVAQYMNCQEAYYKNFDDHGRLLRLRRLCYAIFGGKSTLFKIIKASDGTVLALTEDVTYIKKADNGCYILCPEPDASGISYAGTPYQLFDRDQMGDELETVMLEQTDIGSWIMESKSAIEDADEMNVDQAYRLTLLELNVSDTDDTENT